MTEKFYCDSPGCGLRASWFVGAEFDRNNAEYSRGHTACRTHLSDACLVTLAQLKTEGETEARLDVRPIFAIESVLI